MIVKKRLPDGQIALKGIKDRSQRDHLSFDVHSPLLLCGRGRQAFTGIFEIRLRTARIHYEWRQQPN